MAPVITVRSTRLEGVLEIVPEVFRDERGFFVPTMDHEELRDAGVTAKFVVEGQSRSRRGTIRGLHYRDPPQTRLVRVARGAILDVVVDIRRGSPSFGQHLATTLDDVTHHALLIPPGFAHGFCVTSAEADVVYRASERYDSTAEHGIAWDDPDLGIEWPAAQPILSARDRANRPLAEIFENLR